MSHYIILTCWEVYNRVHNNVHRTVYITTIHTYVVSIIMLDTASTAFALKLNIAITETTYMPHPE